MVRVETFGGALESRRRLVLLFSDIRGLSTEYIRTLRVSLLIRIYHILWLFRVNRRLSLTESDVGIWILFNVMVCHTSILRVNVV